MIELFKEILPLLQKLAPSFATIIGSPGAGLATSFALSLLGNKFGVNPNEIAKLPKAIKDDPECHDKLCHLEEAFGEWFEKNGKQNNFPKKGINIKVEWDK